MDDEANLIIGDDLASYASDLLQQGARDNNETKVRIGRILSVVAKAIQHDQVQSLARQVEWWARANVEGWKGLI
jgi:hypothetical protein